MERRYGTELRPDTDCAVLYSGSTGGDLVDLMSSYQESKIVLTGGAFPTTEMIVGTSSSTGICFISPMKLAGESMWPWG